MSNRHVVARCAMCERPIWTSQLVKLLGYVPLAKRHPDLGFVARSRSPGQGRGWKVERPLRTLAELVTVAGVEAREQLRKLARQTFQRMWFQGLLSREDVEEVMGISTIHQDVDAPKRTLHHEAYRSQPAPYVAGTRIAQAPQASYLAQTAPAASNTAPPRVLHATKEWKP